MDCALQLTSRWAAVMLPGEGGRPAWHAEVEIPEGAVQPRLQGGNLDRETLQASLLRLVGTMPRSRPVSGVTLVLPDACAKVLVVPIEADVAPGKRMREDIVRWALRDALPFSVDEALIDAQLFDDGASRCLLVVAAHRDVLREYEDAAAAFGPVVRTLPATLACGWGVDNDAEQQLLVYADDDAVGCLVSSVGTPVLVRTRPRRHAGGSIALAVVETLDYAADRLGAAAGRATVSGLAAGDEELAATLAGRAWTLPAQQAGHLGAARQGALAGALRAAAVGA